MSRFLLPGRRLSRRRFIQLAGGVSGAIALGCVPSKEYPSLPEEGFSQPLGEGIQLDMVYIPGGKFLMGSPEDEEERSDREGPQHQVTVPAFYMSRYLVTQAQWRVVSTSLDGVGELPLNPSTFKGENRPVEQVTWNDAYDFCERLSNHTDREYRLPSEAEWEYACRAGTQTRYSFGDELTQEQANFGRNVGETTPVDQYPANAFGLYDMHGNVMEWCEDIYHSSYKGAPTDGSVWSSKDFLAPRVVRGGNWIAESKYCRSAARGNYGYLIKFKVLGFRVCCSFSKA